MTQCEKKLRFLRSTDLFKGINGKELKFTECCLKKGAAVGNRCLGEKAIGIVRQGEISVTSVTADGRELAMKTLYPGDVFGICTIFTEADMPNDLACQCFTIVYYITKSELLKLFGREPQLMMHFMKIYNQKILFLQKKIEMLNTSSVKVRLADYLIAHANSRGEVFLTAGKTGLCSCLGVSRASLYRELDKFRLAQALDYTENKITIKDLSQLRHFSKQVIGTQLSYADIKKLAEANQN